MVESSNESQYGHDDVLQEEPTVRQSDMELSTKFSSAENGHNNAQAYEASNHTLSTEKIVINERRTGLGCR